VRPGFGRAKEFQQDGAISSQIKGTRLVTYDPSTLKRLKIGPQFTKSFQQDAYHGQVPHRQHMAVESEAETHYFTSEPVDHHELKVQLMLTTERDLVTGISAERKSRRTNKYTTKSIRNK
jgi:hypothetical protein